MISFFKKIFKKSALTRLLFFVASDIFLIAVSVWLAFLLRFDGNIPPRYQASILIMIALAIFFIIPIFYFFKLYSFSWSYVSASELISLFKAATVSFLLLSAVIFIFNYFPKFLSFPRSTIFASYILVFIFCGGIRFSKRIYLRVASRNRISRREKTLIVGAGDAGEQILRSILSSSNTYYFPVGFIDDSPMKRGVSIHGLEVLGKISDIPKVVQQEQIKQLIIALPTAGQKTIKGAVELAKTAGIKKIKIAPHINEIISGEVSIRNLKDVEVEDLLGREQVLLNVKEIDNFIKNKAVLITGAAGSIGSELSKQAAKFNPSALLLLDQDETGIFDISEELKNKFSNLKIEPLIADITDRRKMEKVFTKFKPKVIFHAAAYKHVPLMEEQPDEAVKNNIFGTKILAESALERGAEKFIFISTDKAVNPTSVMGATKRVGEMICQAYNQKNHTKFISVRFGNVLNSRGSVIPTFRDQIKRGGPVEITHPEMKRYFMLTSEACLLVMQAGAMGRGGEVFILDMGKPIKILDLAEEMIKLSGLKLDKDIAVVFTKPRPGEKLFEEILTAEEGTLATQNQKIFMAKLSGINPSSLERELEKLKKIMEAPDKDKIMDFFASFVPHFKPPAR